MEVAVTATPIENAAGKIVAGAAIHRDVSERKRREHYLTAQHDATRLLAQVPELEEVGRTILPLIAGAGSWLCGAYWTVPARSSIATTRGARPRPDCPSTRSTREPCGRARTRRRSSSG